jgi:hypothetical protein
MEMHELTHEVWSGLVGETFTMRLDDGSTIDLVLSAAELAPGDASRNAGAHSVVFTGPGDRYFPQQIRPVSHQAIGEHSIFLVPIGEDDVGYQYEAVFTRLAD